MGRKGHIIWTNEPTKKTILREEREVKCRDRKCDNIFLFSPLHVDISLYRVPTA